MSLSDLTKAELIAEINRLQNELNAEKTKDFDFESFLLENIRLQNKITELIFHSKSNLHSKIVEIIDLAFYTFEKYGVKKIELKIKDTHFKKGNATLNCNIIEFNINSRLTNNCVLTLGFDCQFDFYGKKELFSELYTSISNRIAGIIDLFHSQQKLSSTTEKYKSLISNISSAIYEYNENGVFTYISPIIEKMVGIKAETLIGKDVSIFLGKDDSFKQFKINELKSNRSTDTEYRIQISGDKYKWIRMQSNARFVKGNFVGGTGILTDITAQKAIEAELHRSEMMYSTILNVSPDSFILTDMNGTVNYVSPAIFKLYQSNDLSEYIGHNIFEFLVEEDRQRALEYTHRRLKGEQLGLMEYTGKRKDGSTFNFDADSETIRDENGKPTNILYVIRDITRRKKAELALKASEEKYRLITDKISDVVWLMNLKGDATFVSPSIEKFTGYTVDEYLTQSITDRLTPESGVIAERVFKEEILKALNGKDVRGYSVTLELDYVCKDSSIKRGELLITPVFDDYGQLSAIHGVTRDISKKHLAEQKLRTSEALYHSILTASPDQIAITTMDGRLLLISPKGYELFGINNQTDITNYFVFDFILHSEREVAVERIQNMHKGVFSGVGEYTGIKLDGSEIPIEVNAEFIRNENGDPKNMIFVIRDITERKKAEQKLRESEQRYKTFFEDNRSTIILLNPDTGQLVGANKAACEYYGWTLEEIKQMNITQINTLSKEDVYKQMQLTKNKNKRYHNFRHRLKDGSIRDVEVYAGAIVFDNETLLYSIIHDVTERKKTEQKLIDSEARFRTLFENMYDGISIFEENEDPAKRKLIDCNEQYAAMAGRTREELLLLGTNYHLTQKIDDKANEMRLNSLTDRLGYQGSFKWLRPDGKDNIIQYNARPVMLDGKMYSIGIDRDITSQKLIENALIESERNLNYAQEIARMGSWEYNFLTDEYSWSDNNYKILGITKKQKLTVDFFRNIVHPDDAIILDEGINKMLEEKKQVSMDIRVYIPDKGYIWIQNNIVPVLVNDNVVAMKGVNIDITQKKNAEQEILELNRDLEKKIKIRTEELERANEAKSEFLSRMSHELRTPMNSILGFAQLLEMSELDTTQRKSVNHILQGGRHLLNLINEVLDISRIESGKLSLMPEPVHLHSIITELIDLMTPIAAKSNIEISYIPTTNNQLHILADKQSMKQVLVNILNNAIKYNKTNGKVTIDTSQDADNYVVISVTDTGAGITKDNIPKLFNAFQRIGADKTEIEGTGLGLAVVKKLVMAMNGEVGVNSSPGQGSTFWIRMQLTNENSPSTNSFELNKNLTEHAKKATLLYIEDNRPNIDLVEQILSMRRPDVVLLHEQLGSDGINVAMQAQPDLILLDLNLPDTHGSEVLKQLKENADTRDIPVVVVSANAMQHQINEMMEIGAQKYLTKPYDIKEFLETIDQLI